MDSLNPGPGISPQLVLYIHVPALTLPLHPMLFCLFNLQTFVLVKKNMSSYLGLSSSMYMYLHILFLNNNHIYLYIYLLIHSPACPLWKFAPITANIS
jgi:hypothetical protein